MEDCRWVADVGQANAEHLTTWTRTALLAHDYRPQDLGEGRVGFTPLALGASRELSEEEDGAISDDADGLRIWIGEDAYDLVDLQTGEAS